MARALPFEREYQPPRGLDPVLAAVLSTMRDRHTDMCDLLAGLPDGALEWSAGDGCQSLADLARHIAHVELALGRELAGLAPRVDLPLGSQALASGEAELVTLVAECDALFVRAFEAGPSREALAEAVAEFDHMAMHHGQMQLSRQLWELAHADAERTYEHWR